MSEFRSELSSKGHCFHTGANPLPPCHLQLMPAKQLTLMNSTPGDPLSEIFLLLCYIEDTAFDLSLVKSFEVSMKGCKGRALPETTSVVLSPWMFGLKF